MSSRASCCWPGARLESNAPVDGVLIGSTTFDRLPDGSVVEPAVSLVVKGWTEPLEAHVLHEVPTRRRMSLTG